MPVAPLLLNKGHRKSNLFSLNTNLCYSDIPWREKSEILCLENLELHLSHKVKSVSYINVKVFSEYLIIWAFYWCSKVDKNIRVSWLWFTDCDIADITLSSLSSLISPAPTQQLAQHCQLTATRPGHVLSQELVLASLKSCVNTFNPKNNNIESLISAQIIR